MFSLQRLLGKEDKFFDLLEASAQESRTSVQALVRFVKNPDELKTLDEFVVSRRKEKRINDEISEALCKTFVTALEREDIEALFGLVRSRKLKPVIDRTFALEEVNAAFDTLEKREVFGKVVVRP